MTTILDMIDEIEEDLERSDTAAIRVKIAGAIRHYQKTRFWFNETRSVTFNTVAAQADYTFNGDIAAEFYTIDAALITQGTNIIDMARGDYRALEILLNGNAANALPTTFAYFGKGARIYPQPDQIYSVRITGHEKIAGPITDVESDNVWMNEGYDLIMARAKAVLYAKRYRDVEGAAIELQAETDALSELNGATNQKTGTGQVRPTKF